MVDDIEKKNVPLSKVILQPLLLEHTTSLVADAFRCGHDQAATLAKLVQDKTDGNPFFVCQFLRTITQEKLVVFDYADRKWKWSMDQLYSAQYMDNVVDFMIAKIRKLPEDTQKMIQLAACLGNTFTVNGLATVAECTISDASKHLSTVIAAGFLHVLQQVDPADPWKGDIEKHLSDSLSGSSSGSGSESSGNLNRIGFSEAINDVEPHSLPISHRKSKRKSHTRRTQIDNPLSAYPSSPPQSPPITPSYDSPSSITMGDGRYKFVHDRVQEAFYVMVDEQERKRIHLKIARILFNTGIDQFQETLFTLMHHYNLAIDLVLDLPDDSDDRKRIISLNYQAALKAKHSNAIEPARNYLIHARRALPADSFVEDYTQTFNIILLLAEAEYVCGEHQEAYALFDLLLEKGIGKRDKALVHILAASCYESAGNFQHCIQNCVLAAGLFGVVLPERPTEALVREIIDEIFVLQRERTTTFSELGDLPFMDEEHQTAMEALYTAIAGAYLDSHEGEGHHLFFYIAGSMCKLTVQYGVSAFSANAFACFAGALAQYGIPNVYEFGAVAMKMHARIKVSSYYALYLYRHPPQRPFSYYFTSYSTQRAWEEPKRTFGPFRSGAASRCPSAGR